MTSLRGLTVTEFTEALASGAATPGGGSASALAAAVAERGNPNAASDAGVGALLAASALEGAALNVDINLGAIKDESFRTGSAETVQQARTDGAGLRDRALATARAALG